MCGESVRSLDGAESDQSGSALAPAGAVVLPESANDGQAGSSITHQLSSTSSLDSRLELLKLTLSVHPLTPHKPGLTSCTTCAPLPLKK